MSLNVHDTKNRNLTTHYVKQILKNFWNFLFAPTSIHPGLRQSSWLLCTVPLVSALSGPVANVSLHSTVCLARDPGTRAKCSRGTLPCCRGGPCIAWDPSFTCVAICRRPHSCRLLVDPNEFVKKSKSKV